MVGEDQSNHCGRIGNASPGSWIRSCERTQTAQAPLGLGSEGDKPGEFYSPIGIAINRKDQVFVTDLKNARVQKFSVEGKSLGGFDLPLDAPPRKSCIIGGIALDDGGLIYLSFMNQHKVAVYTEDGKLVREWGKRGTGDGEFNQPGGIVLRPDRTLYVTDQCNHHIQKFTTNGKFLAKWGEHGSKPGQFGGPEAAGSRFAGPHFLTQDYGGPHCLDQKIAFLRYTSGGRSPLPPRCR
jgi:DNA-binding beta-propeller fold protein YncE